MIRANLLPRPKETLSLFGLRLDSEYAREGIAALGLSVLVASVGFSLETLRIVHLESDVAEQERAVDFRSIEREAAKAVALETARYERVDRDAHFYRSSGNAIAVQIARIGNRIPNGVRLDAIEHAENGFTVNGEARSIAAIGNAMTAFAGVPDIRRADLVSIDADRSSADSAAFTANITSSPEVLQ
jgi:Tfp pilus assembly protein PilN